MGAESGDAAALVLAHRDRRRGGPARRCRCRARLGERRRVLLRVAVGDDDLDRRRRGGVGSRSARVGEQRPDDVLLLRGRARGAAGARPRRAPGAAPLCVAAARRDRWHGGRGRDLPGLQLRPLVRVRLGDRDVDRHRVRARVARARRAALSGPPAGVHAHRRRRRRHRRARRHRNRLHGGRHRLGSGRRVRPVRRRARRPGAQGANRVDLRGARRGNLGGAARVGR